MIYHCDGVKPSNDRSRIFISDYTGFESDEAIEGSDDEDDEEIESESEEDSDDEDEEVHTMADNGEGDPADGMGSMTDIPGSDR